MANVTSQAPSNWYYSDIDAAEDMVLFPEEALSGKSKKKIGTMDDVVTRELLNGSPNLKRFIHGLDSDDDSDEFEDYDLSENAPSGKHQVKKNFDVERRAAVRAAKDVSLSSSGQCICTECENGNTASCEWEDDEGVIYDTADGDPQTLRIALRMDALDHREDDEAEDTETVFNDHVRREASKICKKQWHEAVLDPDERTRHVAVQHLLKELNVQRMNEMKKSDRHFCLENLLWLRVHYRQHRVVWKDIVNAFSVVSIFFRVATVKAIPSSDIKTRSELANNLERSQKIEPYARPYHSNDELYKTEFREIDEENQRLKRSKVEHPRERDLTIRPIIAHWFKAGVIEPAPRHRAPGKAVVKSTADGQKYLFVDYRSNREYWATKSSYAHLTTTTDVDLLHLAQQWQAKSRPSSRFALLRIWSHTHFYPQMLPYDQRYHSTFRDCIGRAWDWRFGAKDSPGSEWRIQISIEMLLKPHKTQFRDQVIVKRDMVLVMGADEEELKKYVLGVTYAMQSRPWKIEVDLSKSFVNVDLQFLQELDQKWLD